MELNARQGWLTKWEPVEKKSGQQGLAIIFNPVLFEKQAEDKSNQWIITKMSPGNIASYWAGFCWDKAGLISSQAAWEKYVDEFAQGLASPIEIEVAAH